MTTKSFKDLIIWHKAQIIFEMVCDDVKKWFKNPITTSISYQLVDSAGSIGSNIAEGYGRGGSKEFEQFLRYSRGSCAETDNWLFKAASHQLISLSRYDDNSVVFQEEYKMIASFINKLRNQTRKQA